MDPRKQFRHVAEARSTRCRQLSLTLWLFSLGLMTQACAPTLSGLLLESNGEPVYHQDGRINISLIKADDEQESFIVTLNKDGSFDSPRQLKSGTYLVEALVPGYRLQSQQVELKGSQKTKLILEKLDNTEADLIRYSGSSQGVGSGKVNLTPPQM